MLRISAVTKDGKCLITHFSCSKSYAEHWLSNKTSDVNSTFKLPYLPTQSRVTDCSVLQRFGHCTFKAAALVANTIQQFFPNESLFFTEAKDPPQRKWCHISEQDKRIGSTFWTAAAPSANDPIFDITFSSSVSTRRRRCSLLLWPNWDVFTSCRGH